MLRKLVAELGHCRIPLAMTTTDGDVTINIGRWVGYMRTKYKQQRLDPYRITTLEAIPGWDWGTRRSGPKPKQTQRDNEIRNLRRAGITLEGIAFDYGLSKQRIAQLCDGIRPLRKP